MPKRLNQILSLESQLKSEADKGTTFLQRLLETPGVFNGFEKVYVPIDDKDVVYPPESKKVQYLAEDELIDASKLLTKLFDYILARDTANALAKADVEIGGVALLKNVPVDTLLFLEKQLNYVEVHIASLPILDTADEWKLDRATGFYKTDVQKNHKTKKVDDVVVLLEHTKEQRGQAEIRTKDKLEGHWHTTKVSGAVPGPRRKLLLERVRLLKIAVKLAREGANAATEIQDVSVGKEIFDYIFAE